MDPRYFKSSVGFCLKPLAITIELVYILTLDVQINAGNYLEHHLSDGNLVMCVPQSYIAMFSKVVGESTEPVQARHFISYCLC